MKKLLLISLVCVMSSNVFADRYLNLSNANIKCNGYHITDHTTLDQVNKKCTVIKSNAGHNNGNIQKDVTFKSDKDGLVTCTAVNGNKLDKCHT